MIRIFAWTLFSFVVFGALGAAAGYGAKYDITRYSAKCGSLAGALTCAGMLFIRAVETDTAAAPDDDDDDEPDAEEIDDE